MMHANASPRDRTTLGQADSAGGVHHSRSNLLAARAACIALLLAAVFAPPVHAQSAQRYAAQLSAMFTRIRAGTSDVAGSGFELQQRFNRMYATEDFGALSLGIGAQYTVHTKVQDRLRIAGIFFEPRWVPATGSSVVFPYFSARLAITQLRGKFRFADDGNSVGSAFGVGAGSAIRITRSINLDAGVQVVRQQFEPIGSVTFRPLNTYAARIGASVGYP